MPKKHLLYQPTSAKFLIFQIQIFVYKAFGYYGFLFRTNFRVPIIIFKE